MRKVLIPKRHWEYLLILTMDLTDDYPERSSLETLYGQVEEDLLTATSLLEENYTPDNVYRVGNIAAYVLLSRFYLFRGSDEDLDKAIQYAQMAIEQGPMLTRLSMLVGTDKSIYDSDASSEVVWCYGVNLFIILVLPIFSPNLIKRLFLGMYRLNCWVHMEQMI